MVIILISIDILLLSILFRVIRKLYYRRWIEVTGLNEWQISLVTEFINDLYLEGICDEPENGSL